MNAITSRSESQIHFADLTQLAGTLKSMGFEGHPCVVISDETVMELHGLKLQNLLEGCNMNVITITLEPGEQSKSRERYIDIIDHLLSIPIDRTTPIIAFGGGVVGDLAGFVAATLFRGVPFIQIPTTLIAQVDSAIGGKTGINHETGKNLIGSFYPAKSILIDTSYLETLSKRQFQNGLAEVIKAGLIGDVELLNFLTRNTESIYSRENQSVQYLVRKAANVKIEIVKKDEFESGVRAHLNFGHTFAHGIENSLGYGAIGHGEAVGIGMIAALFLSEKLNPALNFEKEIQLIQSLVAPRAPKNLDWDDMELAFLRDKKRTQGKSRYIILRDLGKADVVSDISSQAAKESFTRAIDVLR